MVRFSVVVCLGCGRSWDLGVEFGERTTLDYCPACRDVSLVRGGL